MKIKNHKPQVTKPSVVNRIQSFLFYSLILLIPTQLGKHFWPDSASIQGIRIDYLSPTMYLTDILVALLFVVFMFRLIKLHSKESGIRNQELWFTKKLSSTLIHNSLFIILLPSLFLIGILLSDRIWGALYGSLKLLEMAFVAYYSAKFMVSKSIFQKVIFVLSLGAIAESLIALAQFINKGSIGDLLYFLGERSFNSGTPGIANASLNGELVLRAYGTLPHPNVLAGYLLVVMILVLFTLVNFKTEKESGIKNQELWLTKRLSPTLIHNSLFIIQIASLALGTVALFLSMSRIAIVLWVMVLVWFMAKQLLRHPGKQSTSRIAQVTSARDSGQARMTRMFLFALIVVASLFIFSPLSSRFVNINLNEEAITQRSTLNEKAIEMIASSPLLGVGLGNFLPSLSEIHTPLSASTYLQPVHNIFLLVAAETGLIGLGFFVWFLWKTFRRIRNHESGIKKPIFIIFSTILIIGMFDHYWLTLQQGQLLFAFVIGLCWVRIKQKRL